MQPYIIRVSSQKGGVGKTTISVNLAIALQYTGYDTLLVDSDTTNPSVGFHLGLEKANAGYKQLVEGRNDVRNSISTHAASGLHVIPGVISARQFLPTASREVALLSKLKKTNYRFVVYDTEPGYKISTKGFDEALLVSTPDMPSCSSIIRLSREFDVMQTKHNLLLNRIRNRNYEIHAREIEDMYDRKVLSKIPESEIVPLSIEEKIPAFMLNRRSQFSREIGALVNYYTLGVEPRKDLIHGTSGLGLFSRLLRFFRATK